jgi:hypothetical protein
LTTQIQLAGACTSSSRLPVRVCVVTDCPAAAVSFTAGVVPGEPTAGTTKIWNAGPDVGGGVHWYAQPMFQPLAPTVNGVLVYAPRDCTCGRSTTAGPVAAGTVVEGVLLEAVAVGAEAVVEDPAPDVVGEDV